MSILISSRHLFVHFVLPFSIKGPPGRISFSYADPLAFLFYVDKSIGSGCFFPDLDPSVNLIGHAATGARCVRKKKNKKKNTI